MGSLGLKHVQSGDGLTGPEVMVLFCGRWPVLSGEPAMQRSIRYRLQLYSNTAIRTHDATETVYIQLPGKYVYYYVRYSAYCVLFRYRLEPPSRPYRPLVSVLTDRAESPLCLPINRRSSLRFLPLFMYTYICIYVYIVITPCTLYHSLNYI